MSEPVTTISQPKHWQLDWVNSLRVIAMFLVVILHTTSPMLMAYGKEPTSYWLIADFYNALSRFAVPVFVMITGALLLHREYELGDFLKKRLLRIIPPFLFWSLIFIVYAWYNEDINFTDSASANITLVLHQLKYGASYHLWYVYMLIGLYFIIPILGKFVRNASDKELLYFLIMWLVVMAINQPYLIRYNPQIDLHYMTGYIGYLVLGHYLAFRKFPAWCTANWLFILFIISLIVIISGTYFASAYYKNLSIIFYDPISPPIVILSSAAFMIGRLSSFKLSSKIKKVIDFVGSYTFGIYLSHALILDVIGDDFNIDYKICSPIISIPLIALFVYLSALLLVWIISKIPFGKWIAM
jgi:surface polysaccharide O-acyltransferase-like enzyme